MNDFWRICGHCGTQGDDMYFFNGEILCPACREKEIKREAGLE